MIIKILKLKCLLWLLIIEQNGKLEQIYIIKIEILLKFRLNWNLIRILKTNSLQCDSLKLIMRNRILVTILIYYQ